MVSPIRFLALIAFLLIFIGLNEVQLQQTFIRDCNDPLVLNHTILYGHTYCDHACGFTSGLSSCSPQGFCICPCDPTLPEATFATDLCPKAGDIPDTDPNAMPMCQAQCAALCPGGQGQICGEIAITNGKICTCICPPSACPGTVLSVEVPVPPAQEQTLIIIKPWPLLLKKFLLWLKLVAIKLYIYGLLLVSWFLKYLYLKFVFLVLYEAFLLILSKFLRRLAPVLMPVLRQVFQVVTNHFVLTDTDN